MFRRWLEVSLCVSVALWVSACGQSSNSTDSGTNADAGGGYDAGPTHDAGSTTDAGPTDAGSVDAGPDGGIWDFDAGPLGAPIVADAGVWTWVDFPDSFCSDGSTTGVGVNLSATSSDLIVFFNGGGACWSYLTCFQVMSAVLGPYGAPQLANDVSNLTGTPFDRTLAGNAFADWNYVFVPYCTADVHAGDNVVTYTNGSASQVFHHTGHANALAYLKRLGATFPNAPKVVIAGSSAGGGGASINYAFARAYWPGAEMYLVDDSLPFFQNNPINPPGGSVADWIQEWNLTPLFGALCGGNCVNDFSMIYPALSTRYANDRMALLSFTQDSVVSVYYGMSETTFSADLATLKTNVLDPAGWKSFFITPAQPGHVLLLDQSLTPDGGVSLETWLSQMVTDNPSWASEGP